MCGRFYVSEAELDDFAALIEGVEKDLLKPRPNRDGSSDIVPGDFSPVLVADPEGSIREGAGLPALSIPAAMRVFSWGFPAAQGKGRIINARAETVMDKPLFRLPFSTQRCLVPAQGFYEWSDTPVPTRACKEITCSMDFKKQRPDSPFFFEKEQIISLRRLSDAEGSGIPSPEPEIIQMAMDGFFQNTPDSAIFNRKVVHPKSPRIRHRFTRIDRRMLLMAGLFWTFRSSARDSVTTFTILTVAANADVAPVHDRMPLILEEGDLRIWLTPGISDALAALMVPSAKGTLSMETRPAD